MKYLVYYDTPANKEENRNYVLAAANKIDYVCSVLNRTGQKVELISASATCNRKGCKGRIVQLSDRTSLKLFPCTGRGSLPKRLLGRMLFKSRLFLYLLVHLKRGETLLVYHSLGYAGMVTLLKKIKQFRLILEVEEIYADVSGRPKERREEYRLFSAADAFLFSTELLNRQINTRNKPYVLIHGTYQAEPARNREGHTQRKETGKIHCVYAGTFDPRKGGAIAAVSAAECLTEQYHVHILGSGSEEQTKQVTEWIRQIAGKAKCKITYDGLLKGEAYITFLQGCDIGLSTQNPAGAFNATSFPSKILSYMANGLRVVSARIPVVEDSEIGTYMHYYEEQTPEEIARAIMQVDLNDGYDGRSIVGKLDVKFRKEMKRLLEGER